ncbi:MAG TPA: VWA domain-containing protein, partial [Candidatus Polarisedimenticolia bacterium]|nr:VWA domain-containing protein [Candidatus Polarisedimenticolia bacterium]
MSFKAFGRRLALLAAGLFLFSATPSQAGTNVLFILDSSGSMWEKVDGVAKVVTAKRVLDDTLAKLSADTEIGLMTYGHRRKNDCSDIQVLDAIGADKAPAIAKKVNALAPKGETPIAGALQQSAEAFKNMPGERNIIILITDGVESCKGDPCAAAHALAAANVDLQINVVGFKLMQKQREAVECIAREGRGTYYDASNTKALT